MEVWTVEIGGLTRMALSEGLFGMFFAPNLLNLAAFRLDTFY